MKIYIKNIALVFTLLFVCLGISSLQAQTSYNLSVKSGPLRQSFEGFGVCSTSSWASWDPTLRAQMADLVYRDLKMNVMRFWVPALTGTGANPTLISVANMLSTFNTSFIASGFIADVQSRGISTFLLAPCVSFYPPASVTDYADNIAELILQLKNTYSIQFDVTGIANEPGMWSATQLTQCVASLRSALDSRGLNYVKIITPESSGGSGEGPATDHMDQMVADGTWDGIYGIASHSYWPLDGVEFANRRLDKQWWITEGGADARSNILEYPEDENFASFDLEILLNNLNHGVSEWLHFNGPKQVADFAVTNPGPTMLVAAELNTRNIWVYLQYYYYKQALSVFDTGAIFRQCLSDTEGDMLKISITKQNPAINAAAAYNPDGSWGINIINSTGITGTTANSTNIFYPETTYNVNLTVEELANTASKTFTIYRSRANNHIVQSGTLTLVNGVGTISIAPRELVSLRSGSTALTKAPAPNGLTYKTINDHLGLSWNNTVNATSWKVKRATTSGGPYTTIATTATTFYDDTSAANGTVYYYVVSALNSLGESANSSQIAATPAPFPWTNGDIGTVAVSGSCVVNDSGVFKIYASGANIGSVADSFNYTYIPMSGTGTIIARLVKRYEANVKIGLAICETLGTSPKASYLLYNFNTPNSVQMYNRTVDGNYGSCIGSSMTGQPMWMKLVRTGTTFTGYASSDGATWTTIGSANIAMGNSCYVGMAVCGMRTASPVTKTWFDNVSAPAVAPTGLNGVVLAASPGQVKLNWTASYGATSYNIKRATVSGGPYTTIGTVTAPTISYTDTTGGSNDYYVVSAVNDMGESANSSECQPWINADIGTLAVSGSCDLTGSGAFTIYASGSGIGCTADSFNYTYLPMSGTGTIIARLVKRYEANVKIGLAICETLGTSPKASYLLYNFNTPNSVQMYNRTVDGNYASVIGSSMTGQPMWLKLVRTGTTFTGYASSDGATWTTIGSANIAMGNSCYVGIAVCGMRTVAPVTKTWFDNVSLATP